MNTKLQKLSSLTLMTIMLAGGMTIAAPGMIPEVHAANANLFVSAEKSQFNNYMSGPQVIEVVIIDSDLNDTDESKGEPDVTINGKVLRMAQAIDGNWYAYFADVRQAQIADRTTFQQGLGADFGAFCSSASSEAVLGVSLPETVGFTVNSNATDLGHTSPNPAVSEITTECTFTPNVLFTDVPGLDNTLNVVREAKDLNSNDSANTPSDTAGQIGIRDSQGTDNVWPFIQLYALNPTGNVIIQYNKGGGTQSTTLTFDDVDEFAKMELDREKYPTNAQVHVTITDLWLNIDPTDEDSWTFTTNPDSLGTFYQVFDENGELQVGDPANPDTLFRLGTGLGAPIADSLMCENNCILILDTNAQNAENPVITIQSNDDSTLLKLDDAGDNNNAMIFGVGTNRLNEDSVPVTITETQSNTGVFTTYDEGDISVLKITSNAARGTSATLDYNETPTTILTGFEFATIDIKPHDDEWNSGEEIPVVIIDGDANKNSRTNEDFDLFNPDIEIIPTLVTGDPFTLGESTDTLQVRYFNNTIVNGADAGDILMINNLSAAVNDGNDEVANATGTADVQRFSQRALLDDFPSISSFDNSSSLEETGIPSNQLVRSILIDLESTVADLKGTINNNTGDDSTFTGYNMLNYDLRSLNFTNPESAALDIFLLVSDAPILNSDNSDDALNSTDVTTRAVHLVKGGALQGYDTTNGAVDNSTFTLNNDHYLGLIFQPNAQSFTSDIFDDPIVVDFFSYGFYNDGETSSDRVANQIIRIEAQETGDNTNTFQGLLEYIMINQLNINDLETYQNISPIADDPTFIVIEDLTDEDSPRVNYFDVGSDGVATQIADQQEAPSHSGVVSFDSDSYKIADTVTITLEDLDLNTDSDLKDIYTVVRNVGDDNRDVVGSGNMTSGGTSVALSNGDQLGRLLDITFDDGLWTADHDNCTVDGDDGLGSTGFSLIETGKSTGTFVGDFQIPREYCPAGEGTNLEGVTGLDIEVNYVDFRDSSGELIEVGDSAGVRANTGSVSLDRTVYPVPFGVPDNFGGDGTTTTPEGRSVFPIHQSGTDNRNERGLGDGEFINGGDLMIHVNVNDPDFDVSASGEDVISERYGPVEISISRGSDKVILGYAGNTAATDGVIGADNIVVKEIIVDEFNLVGVFVVDDGKTPNDPVTNVDVNENNIDEFQETNDIRIRTFGPITETAPDAGIFEADITIKYTDGPASSLCPTSSVFEGIDGSGNDETDRFSTPAPPGTDYCILQGDILQVEYTDPADASGDTNTVTDSATFDLRNGVLQSDKSVYIIGSDMILTLIEPDFDLDNDQAETYDLDLIEWDSDAATISMGDAGPEQAAFDPEPINFRETGDSTGIFQIVIEIPEILDNDSLERGEEIILEYTDWGPAGADFVGDEDEDVNLTVYTSNFGATVKLDQRVYSWTEKIFITITAPDHNFDSDLVDEIGDTERDPLSVSTRGNSLDLYKLVETGTDTGIFTGEVILTGFTHDADGDGTPDTNPRTTGEGPTSGFLQTDDDDGLSISYEFSEDETVIGSALIRWNIGQVQWLQASYPATAQGVVRVVDPDMNLDPEAVDNFDVDVWSDSDAGGIDLTVTETNESTGHFEGTVFFTITDDSSGHRLRVAESDTVTAEYEDNTLPDPYSTTQEEEIKATTIIGTIVEPLSRAPATNLRIVDTFGSSIDTVAVDQQIQLSADLANGQDIEQPFAYLVQIQDSNDITVQLAWFKGSLTGGQAFSPALSWTPSSAGVYTVTAFVWESVDNPTALSPPISIEINVS